MISQRTAFAGGSDFAQLGPVGRLCRQLSGHGAVRKWSGVRGQGKFTAQAPLAVWPNQDQEESPSGCLSYRVSLGAGVLPDIIPIWVPEL